MSLKNSCVLWTMLLLSLSLAGAVFPQDSLNVSHVAQWNYLYDPGQVVFRGHYAYITAGGGLIILDLADPAHPREVSREGQSVAGVALYDHYTIVSSYTEGLIVLDVLDPIHPVRVAVIPDAGCGSIMVHDHYAYIFANEVCMGSIVDLADPSNPELLSSIPWQYSEGIVPVGDYLVGASWSGEAQSVLNVLDMTNPIHPDTAAQLMLPDWVTSFALAGYYLYVATYDSGMRIIDFSDPVLPVMAGIYRPTTRFMSVVASGDTLYALDNGDFVVLDILAPLAPVEVGRLTPTTYVNQIVPAGRHALLLANDTYRALTVVDPRAPGDPAILGYNEFGGLVEGCALTNEYTCLATRCGLAILSNLTGEQVSYTPTEMDFVAVQGDRAYGGYPFGSFRVFDISNPLAPQQTAEIPDMGYAHTLFAVGDSVYAVVSDNGEASTLRTYDISNPDEPVQRTDHYLGNALYYWGGDGFCLDGYWLYFANHSFSFMTINLARNGGSGVDGQIDLGMSAIYTAVQDHYVFLGCGDNRIRVVDVSNPMAPYPLGTWAAELDVHGLTAEGNTLYVNTADSMLHVYDVSNPVIPVETGYYATPLLAGWNSLRVVNHKVLVQNSSCVGLYDCAAAASAHKPSATPFSFNLAPCYPNPFNPSTLIRFSLPASAEARMTVYDLLGREVSVILAERMEAGTHEVTFRANGLASGLYFCELRAAGQTAVQKMMLMK